MFSKWSEIKANWKLIREDSAEKASLKDAQSLFEKELDIPSVSSPERMMGKLPTIQDTEVRRLLKLRNLARNWQPPSDVITLRYGHFITTAVGALTSVPLTYYLIKSFNLKTGVFYMVTGNAGITALGTMIFSLVLYDNLANFRAKSQAKFQTRSGLGNFFGTYVTPVNLGTVGVSYLAYMTDSLPPYKSKFITSWLSKDMLKYAGSVLATKKFMGISACTILINLLSSQLYADQLLYEWEYVYRTTREEYERSITV